MGRAGKKFFLSFLILLLSGPIISPPCASPATVSPRVADFLCEKGITYYDIGRYTEALVEFKKAILANPDSVVAREFISIIEEAGRDPSQGLPLERRDSFEAILDRIEEAVDLKAGKGSSDIYELEDAVLAERRRGKKRPVPRVVPKTPSASAFAPLAFEEIVIDADARQEGKDHVDVDARVGDRIIMRGRNITRFLVTEPAYMKVARQENGDLLVEPQDIGTTYVHIWDDAGRNTFKYTLGPRRFVEQLLRQEQERARELSLPESFKFTYSIDSDSFYTGRGAGDLERQSINYSYSSSMRGEIPYGNLDAAVVGNRTDIGTYRVSTIRVGLTNGHYDQFKNFTIRALDFTPSFTAFGFPTSDLRGILLNSPAFHDTLNYTAFWGALPAGGFTQLPQTSGLSPTQKAWLEGMGLNYRLGRWTNFKSFYAHSYGPERAQPVLTSDVTGFGVQHHWKGFDIDSEMVYDFLKNISYTVRSSVTMPKLRIGLSTTDNDKDFANLLGGRPASGSTSQVLTLDYRPSQDVTISNSFSATRDNVFGNPDRPGRPNYNSTTRLIWTPDIHNEFEFGYTMQDQIGSVAPAVIETKEAVFRKKLFFIRKLSAFLTYQNTKSKFYTSPAQDFNNNRVVMGVSSRLLYDIYGYWRQEFDFLKNRFTGETAFPMAQEFGLNYNRQIFDSPFYTNLRLFYRNEEHTESVLSFMSGEDRLEGEAELSYKPTPDNQIFIKARVADVWAEKTGVAKHFDFNFSWGVRLLWDTAFRWETVGGYAGYVFYDLNGDGIRQPQEKGVKDVLIRAQDGTAATTGATGYYRIARLKGRRTTLSLDTGTIPKGYNLTTPATKDVPIVHAKIKRVDFGIATRSEIAGLIFHDKNGNGAYDAGEEPIAGVVVTLDGKTKALTNPLGEYMFRKLEPGDHTLKLDLKSVPVEYIPKVAITKDVHVIEGATFVHNIPLASQSPQKE